MTDSESELLTMEEIDVVMEHAKAFKEAQKKIEQEAILAIAKGFDKQYSTVSKVWRNYVPF